MLISKSPAVSGLLIAAAALFQGEMLTAAPKDPPPATQNLAEVDSDFRYQGEYMGYLPGAGKVGLQIVARGQQNFDVVLYDGGLPGDGWDEEEPQRAQSVLEDGVVAAEVGDFNVSVARNQAFFSDGNGRSLGVLRKYDRRSATIGLPAPSDAVVLFDGRENDHWKNMKVTEDGLLQEGCETVDAYGDFTLHLEFRLPYKPLGTSQDRGNSGVYLQRRYEVQVLDSFGDPLAFNHCGAIYRVKAPERNMCLPPLSWQTYDIKFRAARFDDEGNKTENMKITVKHNGIVIHDAVEITTKTGAGKPEGPEPMTILLQDHGNPVRYRNIWLKEGDPFTGSEETMPSPEAYADAHSHSYAGYGYTGYGYGYGGYYAPKSYYGPYTIDWMPYTWDYRMAPLAPPAPYYMHPNHDLPPYPYNW